MKKYAFAALCLIATIAGAQVSVLETSVPNVLTKEYSNPAKYTLTQIDWQSNASGYTSVTLEGPVGTQLMVSALADQTSKPTNLYDVRVTNFANDDVLTSQGLNLSNSAAPITFWSSIEDANGNPMPFPMIGRITLWVTNAGAYKRGQLFFATKN